MFTAVLVSRYVLKIENNYDAIVNDVTLWTHYVPLLSARIEYAAAAGASLVPTAINHMITTGQAQPPSL